MEKENLTCKRIVVISEASLTNEASGMAQTLGNLFDNYSKQSLLFCSPKKSSGRFKKIKSISYNERFFDNSFFKKLFSLSIRNRFFKKITLPSIIKKILWFSPDIIVVSNLDYYPCLIVKSLLKQKELPLCVYLMDYISKENEKVFDSFIKPLMQKAGKHIFISKYMAERCIMDYPQTKTWIVIHNPVEEKEIAVTPIIYANKNEITFGYAGSLWPMHADAIVLFAKALQLLKEKAIKARLVVYTTPYFHTANQKLFEDPIIVYGGFYRFDFLKPHLLQHSALVVGSSFEKKYYDLSAYSIQTKVTDYLASGVPVVAIGPAYAACNKFIKENDCGFTIESDNVALVADEIKKYLEEDSSCLSEKANKGLALMRENYQKDFVQDKLYRFLSA